MPIIPVQPAGKIGLNKDLSQHELPIEVWTDSLNYRFLDGYAHQCRGYGEYYTGAEVVPHHLLPVLVGDQAYWIYASLAKIYAVKINSNVITHTNLTRQALGVDINYSVAANGWTSSLLSGIPILNPGNTTDYPQQWDLNITHRFEALANWPLNTYAKSLRAFGNFLIAMNITEGVNNYPFMIRWSNPADPGSVPTSWDYTDPTVEAGRYDLGEGYGQIVDGLQMKDSFMIYREKSIHRLDLIGGIDIFRISKVLGDSGALNRNCIVEVLGQHVVLTSSDIIVHDGYNYNSILDKQMRRWFFLQLDVTNYGKCFVFKNTFFNEVYICYPSVGATSCNMAVVWNYVDKTVALRELPDILCANIGPVDSGYSGIWATDNDPWGVDDTSWDGPGPVPWSSRVQLGLSSQKIQMLDESYSWDGVIPETRLERRGISFGDANKIKLVKSIMPRITGQVGSVIYISVGYHSDLNAEPVWTRREYTIGSTVACFFLVSGRYIAIKFENKDSYKNRLDSYDIDVEIVGSWP